MCGIKTYLQRGNSAHVERVAKGFLKELTSEPRWEGQERPELCYERNCIPPSQICMLKSELPTPHQWDGIWRWTFGGD